MPDEKKTAEEPEAEAEAKTEPKAKAEVDDDAKTESNAEAAPDAEPGGEDETEEEDESGIDALAKRVDALGGDDEIERIAREEEEKLAARRARQKTGRRKGQKGLEAAASKRLAKIGAKARPKRAIPEAVEAADPLIERTQAVAEWARKNRNLVQGLIVAAVLAAIGGGVWMYHDTKRQAAASAALAQAVADERGRIGDPESDDEGVHDTTPIFKTPELRRDAALAKYREVESKFKGTGAAWLARLGEGALLLDQRDPGGAIAAFEDVLGSSLAQADPEVRGRALENLGFAYELRAQMKPEGAKADIEKALEQYKQLESSDVLGFAQMAPYHEARCYELQGDQPKAIDTLKKLRESLMKNPDSRLFGELRELTDDRLRALDPTALPPKRAAIGAGGQITPEMLQKLSPELRARILKNLQKGMPQ